MQQRCPECGSLAPYLVVGRDGGRRCEACHDSWHRFQDGPEVYDVPDASPAKVVALFTLALAVLVAAILGMSW